MHFYLHALRIFYDVLKRLEKKKSSIRSLTSYHGAESMISNDFILFACIIHMENLDGVNPFLPRDT